MASCLLQKMKRGLKKPLSVVVWRLFQECRLSLMRITGAWSRIEKRANTTFNKQKQSDLIDSLGWNFLLVDSNASASLSEQQRNSIAWKSSRLELADNILERNFKVFGEPIPSTGDWPWSNDWRFNKVWGRQYFKTYNFYEKNKSSAWDIKFPWEVSRLTWFLPVLQAALLNPEKNDHYLRFIESNMHDWVRENPYAYSVSWYPMEVAMRSISFVLSCDLLALVGSNQTPLLNLFLIELVKHGEFLWRTIEYSDIRGNHYFAEVTALFLISMRLRSWYPPARKWERFARKHLEKEIMEQFLKDGVHFEKSVPYHRLVLELALLAALAASRSGAAFNKETLKRLNSASSYLAAVRRPDRLSPNIGDNDNARILVFDPVPIRDHQAVLELAAGVFGNQENRSREMPTSVPFLFFGLNAFDGAEEGKQVKSLQSKKHLFDAGGMYVTKTHKDFFVCDFGEVGTRGRGGHGHNDLFSFELGLDHEILFVDSGCPVYTGDQQKRNKYRSTVSHNTIQIDSKEIAEMSGVWEIANTALPYDVAIKDKNDCVQFRASHDGYARLPDPVRCTRIFNIIFEQKYFSCEDEIKCKTTHAAKRFFHCNPKLDVKLRENSAIIFSPHKKWILSWDTETKVTLSKSLFSDGYGEEEEAFLITLENMICGSSTLKFVVEALAGEADETGLC